MVGTLLMRRGLSGKERRDEEMSEAARLISCHSGPGRDSFPFYHHLKSGACIRVGSCFNGEKESDLFCCVPWGWWAKRLISLVWYSELRAALAPLALHVCVFVSACVWAKVWSIGPLSACATAKRKEEHKSVQACGKSSGCVAWHASWDLIWLNESAVTVTNVRVMKMIAFLDPILHVLYYLVELEQRSLTLLGT